MDIEKLKYEAQNKALHIADVSGSALFNADCMDILPLIPDKSVQLILADLPYGTTACKWDSIIPLEPLWKEYKRIIKDNGAIVLTASQPFTTKLISSNYDWFKYEWIWEKDKASNFFMANKTPLKAHENILVFGNSGTIYNPQKTTGHKPANYTKAKSSKGREHYNNIDGLPSYGQTDRFPRSVQKINVHNSAHGQQHPSQKPTVLFEYLLKTYSNENMTIFDPCMGSGTTGVACKNLNRNFIGIEKDETYFKIAQDRIAAI